MKYISLVARIEKHAVFFYTRDAEVIGFTTHGNNQRIIMKGSLRDIFNTIIVYRCCNRNFLLLPVEPLHASQPEGKMIAVCQCEVAQFIFI